MLRTTLLVLMVFGTSLAAWAGAELLSFSVYPVVDHSRLEWATGLETNLKTFVVERSSDGQSYVVVGQVPARGSYSQYEFTDSSPLDADRGVTFFYRLKLVDRDGTFRYSEVRQVSLTFSAVQQTWGSIKAMFR
jgi:hypothetical protein